MHLMNASVIVLSTKSLPGMYSPKGGGGTVLHEVLFWQSSYQQ